MLRVRKLGPVRAASSQTQEGQAVNSDGEHGTAMSITIKFNEQFRAELATAAARGLQRAGVYFHSACVRAVNKSNVFRHRARFNAAQRAKRGGQKTGVVYENMRNAFAGEPPFKRTGGGQSGIVYEYNDNPLSPAVRVGVRKNEMYMFFLDQGTSRIKPRHWLKATYDRNEAQIKRLALSGLNR
jgi:hypothetical protein